VSARAPSSGTLAQADPPRGGDAVDRGRRQVGPIGKDHRRGRRVAPKRLQAAAKRGPWPTLPVRARNNSSIGIDVVGAGHDHHLVDLDALLQAIEHLREQQALLRRPVTRRRTGGEHDGSYLQPFSDRQSCITSCTYASEARFGAPSALSTAVGPAL
jgi:hypothetical protein